MTVEEIARVAKALEFVDNITIEVEALLKVEAVRLYTPHVNGLCQALKAQNEIIKYLAMSVWPVPDGTQN